MRVGEPPSEPAGEYGGPEAFHRMLGWLFSVDGKFTSPAAAQPGLPRPALRRTPPTLSKPSAPEPFLLTRRCCLKQTLEKGGGLGALLHPYGLLEWSRSQRCAASRGFASGGGCGPSATGPKKGTSAGDYSTALGRLVSDWQEGSRPNLGPDHVTPAVRPVTAKPVVVIGDMAEDGFRRDVPKARWKRPMPATSNSKSVCCRPIKPSTLPPVSHNSTAGHGVAKPPFGLVSSVRMATRTAQRSCSAIC